MRIKTFTLMLLTFLVSTLSLAQKHDLSMPSVKPSRQAPSLTMKGMQTSGMASKTAKEGAFRNVAARRASAVVPPEGGDVVPYILSGDNSRAKGIRRVVRVVWASDTEIYIQGVSYFIPDAYIKGTVEGNTITFKGGQYFGQYKFTDGAADMYFYAYDTESGDCTATISNNDELITFNNEVGDYYVLGDAEGFSDTWSSLTLTMTDESALPVEPPTGMETADYAYAGVSGFSGGGEFSRIVKVGFYGNEVYLQGISEDIPGAWIKGTLDNGIATFATGQLLGQYSSSRSLYFHGLNEGDGDPVIPVEFSYDAESNTFINQTQIIISYLPDNWWDESANRNALYEYVKSAVISKIVEKPATPENPSISNMQYLVAGDRLLTNVTVVDTEGKGIVADKLYYKIYSEDELGTQAEVAFSKELYPELVGDNRIEIPYTLESNNFSKSEGVALLMEHSGWTKVGLQSIYFGGGERHESGIVWYTLTKPTTITLPEGLKVTSNVFTGIDGDDKEFSSFVNVALDGDDIYIQGLAPDADDSGSSWVKGTKNDDGNYVFALGQEVGTYSDYFRLFLLGAGDAGVEAPVLVVDNTNGVYKFQTEFIINAAYTDRRYQLNSYNAGSTIAIKGESDDPVTPPASMETKDAFMAGYLNTGSAKVTLQNVKMGKVDNDIYIQGVYAGMPEGWVKGTLNTETNIVTFEPQPIGIMADKTKRYFVGTTTGSDVTSLQFSYSTTQKGETLLELVKPNYYSISPSKTAGSVAYYGYNLVFHDMQATETVPDELVTADYALDYDAVKVSGGQRTYTAQSHNIKFGVLNNKAYLKGLSSDAPNAWIIGDVEGSKITFETPQALTSDGEIIMLSWDITGSGSFLPNVELTWNAETKELTSVADNEIMVNSVLVNRSYTYERMAHLSAKEIADVAATPAKPEFENLHFTPAGNFIGFTIKTVDTEGEGLLTDKLFYKFYSKGESGEPQEVTFTTDLYKKLTSDMTEIPYGFVDDEGGYDFGSDYVYLNMDIAAWKEIGLQAIYKGGNATNTSEIAWYSVVYPSVATLPESAETTTHAFTGTQGSNSTAFSTTVNMAKVDNDLYIQGLYGEAWIKGTLTAENTYTFSRGQYLGGYASGDTKYLLFLLGTDALTSPFNVVDPVIVYNATNNQYELVTNFLVNATYTDRSFFLRRYNIGSVINATPTGIETVKADSKFNADAPAYNMAGQRVNNSFKGMIIKDGQKFMKK